MLTYNQWEWPVRNVRPSVDWSAREIKRMSQMVRADEPLEEELHGLAGLGALIGMMLGEILLGSMILGMVLGAQIAPALGFIEGPRGDQIRAAGWRAARCCARLAFDICATFDTMETWAHQSGLTRAWRLFIRRSAAVLRIIMDKTDARGKALALRRLLSWLCTQARYLWKCSRVPSLWSSFWSRTGISRRLREYKQRSILNARIHALRAREGGSPQVGF